MTLAAASQSARSPPSETRSSEALSATSGQIACRHDRHHHSTVSSSYIYIYAACCPPSFLRGRGGLTSCPWRSYEEPVGLAVATPKTNTLTAMDERSSLRSSYTSFVIMHLRVFLRGSNPGATSLTHICLPHPRMGAILGLDRHSYSGT